jgi:cytochrome c oxidase subunit 1
MEGIGVTEREVLCTTPIEAEPDMRHSSSHPSLWPLATAIATTALFIGSIFHEWAVIWGSIPVALCLIGWMWPTVPSKLGRKAAK